MNGGNHLRVLSVLLVFLIGFGSFSISASAEPLPPAVNDVGSVCVVNIEYGKTVYSLNADKLLFPAATAKLVTALVAERYFSGNLSTKIEITSEMKAEFRGRVLGLATGEQITVESLLHAMLIGGYNDAAIALAFAVSGNIATFSDRMNEYIRTLGLQHTHYTNPTGLHDPAMVTTASDTARVGAAIMANDTLFAITKKQKYVLPATNKSDEWTIYTRNALISSLVQEGYFYSYAAGINAGSTDEAGECVVTSGKLDGLSYVCVVLGGSATDKTNTALVAAKNALRYALSNFSVRLLKNKKQKITTLPVLYSATVEEVPVYMTDNLEALILTGTDIDKEIIFETNLLRTELEAPFESGTVVGSIRAVDKNGNLLAETELMVSNTVEAHGFLVFMAKTKNFVTSKLFLVLLLLFLFLVLPASVLLGKRFGKKRRPYRRLRFRDDD